jgi:hypothetical protein
MINFNFLLILGSVAIVLIAVKYYNKKDNSKPSPTESESNMETFSIAQCQSDKNICNNFKSCCLNSIKPNTCRDSNLLACQKFKIKCENKCNNKNIDDENNIAKNTKDCLTTCKTVQQNCCDRLFTS